MADITQTATDTLPRTVTAKIRMILREIALMVVVVLLAALITRTAVETLVVTGVSMAPTLQTEEHLLVNKIGYWLRAPQRGDVVTAREPEFQSIAVKRIIGLPGDELSIEQGQAFINGQMLDEPYLPPTDFVPAPVYAVPTAADIAEGDGRWLVPDGHYFILGDDRHFSSDSRDFGPIPVDAIRGKVLLIAWPPQRWGLVRHRE